MLRRSILALMVLFVGAVQSSSVDVTITFATGVQQPCNNCTNSYYSQESYSCSQGDEGFSSSNMKSFLDPIPPGHFISGYKLDIYGRFICVGNATRIMMMLASNQIVNTILTTAEFPFGCSCPSCTQVLSFPPTWNNMTGPITSYLYGFNNYITPFVPRIGDADPGALCLSKLILTLYYESMPPDVFGLVPQGGPNVGGTSVTITGLNFKQQSGLRCKFGSFDTPATYLSSSSVICVAPNVSNSYTNEVVSVCVTTDGIRYSATSALFYYYIEPEILSISPTEGELNTSTTVTITGSGFIEVPPYALSVKLRFGDYPCTNISIHNSTMIHVAGPIVEQQATVAVGVSLNGLQWEWGKNLTFHFKSPQPAETLPFYLWLSIAGAVFLLVIILVVIKVIRSKKKNANGEGERKSLLGTHLGPDIEDFGDKQLDIAEIKLGNRIGKGSFGEVYIGTWQGTTVAVKKLPAHKLTDEFLREFAREARLMRSLRHPNVLQFLGACLDPPDICIVTEYMVKLSLYHLIHDKSQAFSWERIRLIALDAAKGMAYLHYRNPAIIHRDLKSHNLLVDENWKVKVCDFGLSRIYGETQVNAMTACGTPCWTAPEILRNSSYSIKADVYSFGVVLWELASREEPFLGLPAFQVIFAVGTKGARPEIPNYTPETLKDLIQSCWNEDPNVRPTFHEIIEYLEKIRFDDPPEDQEDAEDLTASTSSSISTSVHNK